MNESKYYWAKTHAVDLDRYADLLSAAIGSRSLREYARLCGCSAAALTRIMHKQNSGPSRQKLIEAIAKHAAPDSGVTLEMIADANGYVLKTVSDRWNLECSKLRESPTTSQAGFAAQSIWIQSLTNSGQSIQILPCDYQYSDYCEYVYDRPNLLVEVRDLSGNSEILYCDYRQGMMMPFDLIHCIERYTLFDALRYEGIAPLKFFLLLSKPELYDEVVERFGNKKMPVQLFLVLVDVDDGVIVRQYGFQRKKYTI